MPTLFVLWIHDFWGDKDLRVDDKYKLMDIPDILFS